MMKRLFTIALLFSVFAANSVLAGKDWKSLEEQASKLDADAKKHAEKELEAAKAAEVDLDAAKEAAGNKEATKEDKENLVKAQVAYDAAVAKVDARFPSMLCKVESFVTWPARKAGELLQNKWGARVATAAGVAAVAYCVYTVVNDNADDEADDMRTWA